MTINTTIVPCGQLPAKPAALKIAILLNSYRSPFISEIRDSYVRSIGAVSPDSSLSFFYPADHIHDASLAAFPDPAEFDLIVVGGGNADPRKKHAWILKVHRFILDLVSQHPRKKVVGICWGHQTISMLFGAEIVDMEMPELGVIESKLTPAGSQFFALPSLPKRGAGNQGYHHYHHHHGHVESAVGQGGILRLQQHHRRAVGTPPKGFSELLAGNQSFLSHNNTILTFQGHPEKDARCAKLRIGDAMRWYGVDVGDHVAMGRIQSDLERQHDGHEVWARVLDWAREKVPDHSAHPIPVHGGGMHL